MITDQQDFVWIMHNDRVQRFDGKYIKDFIPGATLNSIICDNDNRIWVSSFSKLYRFINDHKGFIPVPVDTIKNLSIYQLYKLSGMRIWALTNKGFYVLDTVKQVFRKHPDPALANLKQVHSRGMDDGQVSNTLFFGAGDSLMAYHLNTGFLSSLPVISNIRKVATLSDDLALVSTWTGLLYLYDFAKRKVTLIDISLHLKNVPDFFISVFKAKQLTKDKFIFATDKGLLEYNILTSDFRQLKLFYKGKPLEGDRAFRDIYFDNRGTAWAAYNHYGVISFKKDAGDIGLVRNYETDITKAWDNNVRNFAEDEKGNLWLATVNGFACWDMQKGAIQPYFAKEGATDRLNHSSIRGIVYDGHNLILGQTNKGIWLYNPATNKYRRPFFLPGDTGETTRKKTEADFIDQIYTLRNGDHVIIGNNGGFVLNGKTYIIHELDFPGKKEDLEFCYQDSKKNIWIGTVRALYCLDSNFVYRFKIVQTQTSGIVNCMCEWSDGTLITGGNGLHLITAKDAVPALSKIQPFFDNIDIYILFKDKHNKLWLATSEGLFRFDMHTQKIESFSNFENIEGSSFYPNSFCRNKQGTLFLGSSRGIIYFNPEQIREEKDSLNIFISKVMVNEDDTTYSGDTGPARLKYFQNNIAFDFIAPYFGNTKKLKYRYRLQGLDIGWIENRNSNTIRFHALQPGNYEFRAAASINGTDWFESKEKIAFSISPPFWKTGWFYTLVALIIAAALYTLYRYQLNKKLEVERLRMGIARDLHDDIGSALSNIHIISSMALKKRPDDRPDIPEFLSKDQGAGQVFSKIKESSKKMLENMQDIVWAINPENDSLEHVIAKMKEFAGEICEAANIEYYFDIDNRLESIRLTVNRRKDLFLVFKEAMNNAVKYSECSQIHISLRRKQDGRLRLQVKDNGKGFVRNKINPGNGLKNMEERAKEVNGHIVIESKTGDGTSVEMQIPIT